MEKGLEPDPSTAEKIHDVHQLTPPRDEFLQELYRPLENLAAFAGFSAGRATPTNIASLGAGFIRQR
jgi:hypothetical protein